MYQTINDKEQEAIIYGVKDIITAYAENAKSIFDYFRDNIELRSRTATFINRYGIDVCYCLTGGNRCDQCFTGGIIARYLINIDLLILKDFLTLLLRINKPLRERAVMFMERSAKYALTSSVRRENCCRIDPGEWEDIIKSIKSGVANDQCRPSLGWEHFRNNEWVRDRLVKFMIRWALSTSPCLKLGHQRCTCFLGDIPSRILVGPDPIRREELILILFHLDASFRKRIAVRQWGFHGLEQPSMVVYGSHTALCLPHQG